jgi:ankyrin repeat protein
MDINLPSQDEINSFVIADHGDFDVFKSMLRASPNLLYGDASWRKTAIQVATQAGRVDMANYLLAAGAPLDFAHEGMVEWLLEEGARPDIKNYEGKTPLELAQAGGRDGIIRRLEAALNEE